MTQQQRWANRCAAAVACATLMWLHIAAATAGLTETRSFDGSGNNLSHASWGAILQPLKRMTPVGYPDGVGDVLRQAPNPRTVSNLIAAQTSDLPSRRDLSGFVWQWGQFLDHDLSLTQSNSANGTAPIMVADPGDLLAPMIPFTRSNFLPGTGTAPGNPRQQINEITSFIDASNVYGSSLDVSQSLRSFTDGKMRFGDDRLMPVNPAGHFMGGDVRANEQLGLVSMHTLFLREHNRIAEMIGGSATDLPTEAVARDEEIYQRARKVIGAEIQAITYNEFLPALLGDLAPKLADASYDPSIDPSITIEFSTGLYRVGHSMLPPGLALIDNDGNQQEFLPLRDAFFKPSMMAESPTRVDQILKGLAVEKSQEIDVRVVDDVRNFLMLDGMPGGLDLPALNIQRGRDHGLGSYNEIRNALGLPSVQSFAEITSDVDLQTKLASIYDSVDDIDPFVAGLAEDHLPGASVGGMIGAGLIDQFSRLRDGDRFFHLFDPDLPQLELEAAVDLDQLKLGDVIRWNTSITNLQENVFFVPEPSTAVLAAIGLTAFVASRRRHISAGTR